DCAVVYVRNALMAAYSA
ncbi:hypothetical protein CFC21_004538, partial [Triticum aestivum]